MRLAAGRSTLAIITPVTARIGSSHIRFLGRVTARGTAFRPCPNCVVSFHVWCANPETLHGFPASCACAVMLVVASKIQISKIPLTWQKLVKEVLLAIEKLGLQHFMKKTSPGPSVGFLIPLQRWMQNRGSACQQRSRFLGPHKSVAQDFNSDAVRLSERHVVVWALSLA